MLLRRGFTLIELIVVIGVIGVLATVLYMNFSDANEKGRDAKRQNDLRNLQSAVELYKQKYGRYPAMGCSPGSDSLSGENDCSTYIAGLSPEFITRLPLDPKRGSSVGYAYVTNTNGNAYKLMVTNTVESEGVTYNHEFASCDRTIVPPPTGLTGPSRDMCGQPVSNLGNGAGSTPDQCQPDFSRFLRSYAVWGGYVPKTTSSNVFAASNGMLDLTQQVICR